MKGKTKINIELKEAGSAEEVAKLIKKNRIKKDVIISSNYIKNLTTTKKILPGIKTALIYYSMETKWRGKLFISFSLMIFPITKWVILKRAKSANVDYAHLNYHLVTKNFVSKLHKLGYKVNVWTVNHPKTITKMINKKVDGIISNYPDRIKT